MAKRLKRSTSDGGAQRVPYIDVMLVLPHHFHDNTHRATQGIKGTWPQEARNP